MAPNSVTLENVRIGFRNFAGQAGPYNAEGVRSFAVFLDPEIAQDMLKDGWNVKFLKPREDETEPQAYLSVAVSYKGRPPRAVIVTSKGRTPIDESSIETLDWVDIASVDMILTAYEWSVNGNSGIKAYLSSIYVSIVEDELSEKYGDLPEIG